ncbi:MAG: glycosyl hydrolase 53 family protein [Candidatus Promineifilaceae bacterium]
MKQIPQVRIPYGIKRNSLWGLLNLICLIGCTTHTPAPTLPTPSTMPVPTPTPLPTTAPTPIPLAPNPNFAPQPTFFFGADLSYVNEMDDCGATYRVNGVAQDAFTLFAAQGTNLVRARLWHNPTWTAYSNLTDVEKTFRRAQDAGMNTLLTIHYSDDWADPGQQRIPAAWEAITDIGALVQAVYDYTRELLLALKEKGVLPGFVQVGNETNSGMLKQVVELDWPRDAPLFDAGIRAIRDVTAAFFHAPYTYPPLPG